MGKIIGMLGILAGIAYLLYLWILEQKSKHRRMEELIVFLQRSIFAMEEERIYIIDYFKNYVSREKILEESLHEIAEDLEKNVYPDGRMVWENVFLRKKQEWGLDAYTYEIVTGMGKGFFGRCRGENVCFMQRDLLKLEEQLGKRRETDAKERKVWIPVGMLGGIMLMIILV